MNVNKIYRVFKSEGIKGIYIRVKNKIVTMVYGYELDLEKIKPIKETYYMKVMTLDILKDMYNLYSDEICIDKCKILKNRIKNSKQEVGYVVINENKDICGYYHIAYTNMPDSCINYIVNVDKASIYLFDDYTFKSYRGKGSHKYSIYKRLLIGKEKGYKRALVNILLGNTPSEKAYKNYGFERYIRYKYYHIKNLKKTVVKEL